MTSEVDPPDYLHLLGQPTAVCTAELTVVSANLPMQEFLGSTPAAGISLAALCPALRKAQPQGGMFEQEITNGEGRSMFFRFYPRGAHLAVLGLLPTPNVDEHHARLEKMLLMLGRELAFATGEEQLVAVVANGVKRLLPGRCFCVRILDAKSGALTSLYAEGPLQRDAPEILTLRRHALEKVRLPVSALPPGRIEVTDGEEPLLFKGTTAAIAVPLVASGQLFGAIQLEYTEANAASLGMDEKLLIQLANQAAVSMRNAKLIDELTFVRKYLEELLESANALIVATDRNRKVMVFNQAFAALTGFQKQEVLGKDFLTLVPDLERPRVLGVLAESLRGERVHIETAVRAPRGREVRVALSTSTALSPHGDVEGVLAIGQDLTAVRDLERRVVQAEKLSSLGKLAASVAHEINNPMTAVAAYVESLLERSEAGLPPPPDETEKLRKVRDNAQRILRFTQDLVSYARPASDRPQALDLHPVLDLAVSFCSHELQTHSVTLQRAFGTVPALLGVPSHLVQVFVNLITNACHALDRGGTITLRTGVQENRAFVRVEDSGPGIPPEQLSEIFEPFFTTKPAGKGSGLGLSIVRGIVEKHGGQVDVQSTAGNGTAFTVLLPLPGP